MAIEQSTLHSEAGDNSGEVRVPGLQERSRTLPLIFLFFLIAANLLYPDSYTDWGLELGPVKLTMIPIWFALTAPFIIYFGIRNRDELDPGLVDLTFVLLLGFILLRGLAAADNNTRMILAFVGYAFVIYYGARLLVTGEKAVTAACIFMVGLGTFIAAYAIVELAAERNFLYGDDMISLYLLDEGRMLSFAGDPHVLYRSNSTIGHPIALGLVLLQLLPFAFYLAARAGSTISKLLTAAAIVIITFALVSTYSKSVTVTAAMMGAAAFVLFFYYQRQRRRQLLVISAVALAAAGAVALVRYEALAAYNSASLWRDSLTGRFRPVADLFSGDPAAIIFGKGLFQNGSEGIWYDSAYTSTFYEQGVIGFVLAALFITLLAAQIIRIVTDGSGARLLAAAAAFSMAAMMLNGFAFPTFLTWPNMVVFFFVAGLLGSIAHSRGIRPPGKDGSGQTDDAPGETAADQGDYRY